MQHGIGEGQQGVSAMETAMETAIQGSASLMDVHSGHAGKQKTHGQLQV